MYRILYVDDEPGLLEICKLFLERSGQFSIDIITSASEALQLLKENNYDAILSDYQMPGMDGIELLKKVRTSGNTLPFILFTGRGREEVVIEAINSGADFYLQKGGDPSSQFAELEHKTRQAIQKRRAEDELRAAYEQISASEEELREQYDEMVFLQKRTDESQQMLQQVLNTVPVRVFWKDLELRYLGCNESFARDAGFLDPASLVGKTDFEMGWKEQADLYRADDRTVIETGIPKIGYEEPQTSTDGSRIWLRTSKIPLQAPGGTIIGILGTYEDITDRVKSHETLQAAYTELAAGQQALQKSEEMYRTVFENTGTATIIIESDATISLVNSEFERASGFLRSEVENKKKWIDFIVSEDRDRMLEQHRVRRTDPKRALKHYEFRFISRSGEIRNMYLTIDSIPGTTRSVASMLDITDRKKRE